MATKSDKAFDCVKMKDAAQKAVQKQIKGLSQKERLAFFNRKAEAARKRQAGLRER
ncbi:MAG: hypothetical protein HRF49_08345 [bacterium]|jgi:acyl-CoA reductase-like NAD-dependent aldehyde dehydrogenase